MLVISNYLPKDKTFDESPFSLRTRIPYDFWLKKNDIGSMAKLDTVSYFILKIIKVVLQKTILIQFSVLKCFKSIISNRCSFPSVSWLRLRCCNIRHLFDTCNSSNWAKPNPSTSWQWLQHNQGQSQWSIKQSIFCNFA